MILKYNCYMKNLLASRAQIATIIRNATTSDKVSPAFPLSVSPLLLAWPCRVVEDRLLARLLTSRRLTDPAAGGEGGAAGCEAPPLSEWPAAVEEEEEEEEEEEDDEVVVVDATVEDVEDEDVLMVAVAVTTGGEVDVTVVCGFNFFSCCFLNRASTSSSVYTVIQTCTLAY